MIRALATKRTLKPSPGTASEQLGRESLGDLVRVVDFNFEPRVEPDAGNGGQWQGWNGEVMDADAHDRIELTPLGGDAWRVCEAGVPENNALRVIAYVERCDGGFEVVWLRGPNRGVGFADRLQSAVDEACGVLLSEATSSATRPIAISHLMPGAAVSGPKP